MIWKKSPPEFIDLFEKVLPKDELIEKRKMFGYPCSFVNKNMFMGLHQDNLFLRLPDDDREAFLKIENAKMFEPMPGRAMKEYVVVPEQMYKEKEVLNEWINKSFFYVSSLPTKEKKR